MPTVARDCEARDGEDGTPHYEGGAGRPANDYLHTATGIDQCSHTLLLKRSECYWKETGFVA
jgi:hypothetical protein